ncbi:hypothetical protein MTP99_006645 [Tenebrio molitor]|nr:hypothetical protein MTP99_006645 [Tenebrio molitor]
MHGLNAVTNIFVTRFGFNSKLCRSPIFPKPPPCAPDRRLPHSYVGAATRESPLIYGYLYSVCASCHIVTSKQQHRFSGRIGGGGGRTGVGGEPPEGLKGIDLSLTAAVLT